MKQNRGFSVLKAVIKHQLFFPLACFAIVLCVDSIIVKGFFNITLRNGILYGPIMSIFDRCSEIVILGVGMTLVVAASGGTDISVGSVLAFSGSVAVTMLGAGDVYKVPYIVAFLCALGVGALCGAWNGFLVSKLRIQPMVATLILFTAGRGLAFLFTEGLMPNVYVPSYSYLGGYFPGVIFPTPMFVAITVVILTWLVLRFTSLGMQIQSVGINRKAARLVGINPSRIIFFCFMFCGLLAGLAGVISTSRLSMIDANNAGLYIELDAILAVAIGGTSLAGGRFSLLGTVIGGVTIQCLTTSLLAMGVQSTTMPVYKAIAVVIIVVIQSPELKRWSGKLFSKKNSAEGSVAA